VQSRYALLTDRDAAFGDVRERTGDYFTGDGAQTALSRVKLGWDTDDYDELLGALVELEEEDFALG
jgi:hypothetical protein